MKIRLHFHILALTSFLFASCSDKAPKQIEVYPIPQKMEYAGQSIQIPQEGFRMNNTCESDSDAMALIAQNLLISDKGTKNITIHPLDNSVIPEMKRSGAYTLSVTEQGITIGINDGRSLFYAAQTLSQLTDKGKSLPLCSITDYPDVPFRGVVEGFYGTPWSFEDRVSQLQFYGRMKMNTYIFGPKDDPYHRSPYWREPYPADQAQNIRNLVTEAARNKVDFVWAMHPGMDIRWNEADRKAAIRKLESMYDLGVRAFAVFFDDISGEGTDAKKQAAYMNYIKKEFVDKKGDIQQLILCPTEYNKDWAKTDYLNILGENLDPFIHIMWTGDKVVSDITKEGLQWVNKRIQRPSYIWWNFPVSDYCLAHLLMGPVYGQDNNAISDMHAFVSNPMEFAEASKVALWSVSEYTWNMKTYQPIQSWERACAALVPEAPKEFQLFCEHNASIGPNTWMYHREESFNSDELILSFESDIIAGKYGEQKAEQIANLFGQLEKATRDVASLSSNKNLIDEIRPWLIQTNNLGIAGLATMRMLAAANQHDINTCKIAYLQVTDALNDMYELNRNYRQGEQNGIRSGSQVLMPFILKMKTYIENNVLTEMRPKEQPMVLNGSIMEKELACYTEDDVVGLVPHFEMVTIAPGEYFGFQIENNKIPVSLVYDLRKSTTEGRAFQGSEDGKTWTTFLQKGANRIDTIAIDNPRIRYVRFLNESKTDMQIGIGRFHVLTQIKN